MYPNIKFKGKVENITTTLNVFSGGRIKTTFVNIRIMNPEKILIPGRHVKANIMIYPPNRAGKDR